MIRNICVIIATIALFGAALSGCKAPDLIIDRDIPFEMPVYEKIT